MHLFVIGKLRNKTRIDNGIVINSIVILISLLHKRSGVNFMANILLWFASSCTAYHFLCLAPFREDGKKRKIIETRVRRKKPGGSYHFLNNCLGGVCLTAVLEIAHLYRASEFHAED